jgi:hypothetical protein
MMSNIYFSINIQIFKKKNKIKIKKRKMNMTMEQVWEAMLRKDYALLHDLVLTHVLPETPETAEQRAAFASIFALDVAVPFTMLMWHLLDDSTPEALGTAIADCIVFGVPLHRRRLATVRLINYWLARSSLPLLPETFS